MRTVHNEQELFQPSLEGWFVFREEHESMQDKQEEL